eukprot:5923076-Karenia_brevis.AAC.1
MIESSARGTGARATRVKSTKSCLQHFSVQCATMYSLRQVITHGSGAIVSGKKQLAKLVCVVHISAKNAENYCQSQHMNNNSGTVVFDKALPAVLVVKHQK